MNTQIKVSIIIPIYNGAEFLRRIFDSAVYQTLLEIEVIAVNDCSPNPRDAEIMHEYQECYPDKFRAIFHDVNMRQGGARNTGIKSARGEYFLCVDQDDFIDLYMCEKMYKKAKDDDSDIVICNYALLSDGTIFIKKPNSGIESSAINTRISHFYHNVVWIMLVKKIVVVRNELYFPTKTTSDDAISVFWYYAANRISRLNEIMYYHIDNLFQTHKIQSDHFKSLPLTYSQLLELPYYKALSDDDRCKFDEVFAWFIICIFAKKVFIDSSQVYDVKLAAWKENKEILKRLQHSGLMALIDCIDKEIANPDTSDSISKLTRAKFNINIAYCKFMDKCHKHIVIWGAGIRGKHLAGHFIDNDISFEITDSNPSLYGKNVCGKIVKPWVELNDTANIVIVSPLNVFNEIKTKIYNPDIKIFDYEKLYYKLILFGR